MEWKKLIDTDRKYFSRGDVFRCPGKFPYEKYVDFLLINYPDSDSRHALIVATGQKAGHILICLPLEAGPPDSEKVIGISARWLIDNWVKWIYELGPVDVYYTRNYVIEENWKKI